MKLKKETNQKEVKQGEIKQKGYDYTGGKGIIQFLEERHPERKDFRHMSTDDLLMYATAALIAEEDARALEEAEEKYKDLKCPESVDRRVQEIIDKYNSKKRFHKRFHKWFDKWFHKKKTRF